MRDLLTRSLGPAYDAIAARLTVDPDALIAAGLASRTTKGDVVESRMRRFEARSNDDGSTGVTGYATSWDTWYDVAGGAPYGWSESIAKGAAAKSLLERDDVKFLVNHEGLAFARSRGAATDTMELIDDSLGLRFDVDSLDVSRNVFAAALASAIDRGDCDQCSFAFQVIRQEWNADYTERLITELRLFDVSAVTYPANLATIIGLRTANTVTSEESAGGMSLALALAMADTLG